MTRGFGCFERFLDEPLEPALQVPHRQYPEWFWDAPFAPVSGPTFAEVAAKHHLPAEMGRVGDGWAAALDQLLLRLETVGWTPSTDWELFRLLQYWPPAPQSSSSQSSG